MSSSSLKTVISVSELDEVLGAWRSEGLRVAFVPTMGASS